MADIFLIVVLGVFFTFMFGLAGLAAVNYIVGISLEDESIPVKIKPLTNSEQKILEDNIKQAELEEIQLRIEIMEETRMLVNGSR